MPAIAVHHTKCSMMPYDGAMNEKNLKTGATQAYYESDYAWRDPKKNPHTKDAYKGDHHEVSANGTVGAASVAACRAGIGALNGARGGFNIPAGDRQGVWDHFAAHIRDAKLQPAELKSDDSSYEVRELAACEVRVTDEGGAPTLHVSIPFNSLSEPMGLFTRFREKIDPAAFDGVLRDETKEVLSFWNHNTDQPLGRRTEGTVRMTKTPTHLTADISPGDQTWAVDAVKSVRRKDVKGTSFGFRVLPEGERWEEDSNKNLVRVLTNVELVEISPTAMPAYKATSASVRSVEEHAAEFLAEQVSPAPEIDNGIKLADRQRRGRLQRESVRR